MPRKDQASMSIPQWVWEKVRDHYKENREQYKRKGVHSATGVVVNLILENIPRFEHFNVYEDHATVMDHKTKRLIDVYFKSNKPYCEFCEDFDCEHIQFLLNKPDFRKLLREKGWKF